MNITRSFATFFNAAAILAAFFMTPAVAQNSGTVTSHAFAVGKGPGTTGFDSVLCTQAQIAIGQNAAKPICAALSGDVTITAAGVTAIGASKVTNSQLATMAANTTKCNATAGIANPTDCTASTMKTNLGLVIGTNVEAWDTDLDCLAALSSTGVISRTGGGTCSAGALALSGLATGTQDTVIGYFGSTTASATALSNCTGALTYSTSTHTFGCNAAAGTGTVTSVTCGTGLSGGTFTTTGTCALGLTNATVQTGALSPTGTTSTGGPVMMGLGTACKLTPVYSGRILVHFQMYVSNSTTSAGNTVSLRYGTGTAPSNAGAAAGTVVGSSINAQMQTGATFMPLTETALITGLTVGTAYWLDLGLVTTAGTATLQNVSCNAMEF